MMHSVEAQLVFVVILALIFILGLKYIDAQQEKEATQKFKDKMLEIELKYHKPNHRFLVSFKKIKSTHEGLRTEAVEGISLLPEEGKPFILVAKPLTEGATFRMVQTTNIKNVLRKSLREFYFETDNSSYIVKIIEKVEE